MRVSGPFGERKISLVEGSIPVSRPSFRIGVERMEIHLWHSRRCCDRGTYPFVSFPSRLRAVGHVSSLLVQVQRPPGGGAWWPSKVPTVTCYSLEPPF